MATQLADREKVFAPGNLVFGGSLRDLDSYLKQGIRPARAVNAYSLGTPDNLCFSLMSNRPIPVRYNRGMHYAPGGVLGGHTLGIIVSREGLLTAFPDQVFAIGEFFLDKDYADYLPYYDFNKRNKTVFDIPIRPPFSSLSFKDEVRVYPERVGEAAVRPELWTGVVVEDVHLRNIPMFRRDAVTDLTIPVFTPRCTLFAESLTAVTDRRKRK